MRSVGSRLGSRAERSQPTSRQLTSAALASAGLLVLVLAQVRIHDQVRTPFDSVLFLVALGLWALALWFVPARLSGLREAAPAPTTWSNRRSVALAAAIGAGVVTWVGSADGVYTRWNLLAWMLTVGFWLYAFVPHVVRRPRAFRDRRRDLLIVAAVLAAIAVGAFFRFHNLSGVPREPTSDHAEKLLDIDDVLGGTHPIFFPRNTGREPLQFYMTAGLVRLGAKPSFETLKLGTAFVGLLAVIGVLLIARELAGMAAGLLAAALLAVAQWPVSLARDGLRHTFAITASAFAVWLLFRYLRTRSRWDLLLCGLVLGVGLHGYTAFRIVPPFVIAAVAASLLRRPRVMVVESAILLGTVAVTILPLARYAFDRPDLVWFRTLRRVGGSEAPIGSAGDAARTLATNFWNAALAFNWRGDSGNVALPGYEAFLDVATAAAFLAGLVVLAVGLVRRRCDARLWALAAALPVLSASSILNLSFPQENPSASRLGPVAPVVFVIASFSLAYLVQLAQGFTGGVRRGGVAALVAGILGVALVTNYTAFFRDFDRQYRAFVPNTSEAVAALRRTGFPRQRLYIVPTANWIDSRNVGAELGSIGWAFSNAVQSETPLPTLRGRPIAFVLSANDATGRMRLHAGYPNGSGTRVHSDVGKDLIVFVARE